MTFDGYQIEARKTAIYPIAVLYPALGLAGETGEVCEKIKKVIRDHEGNFTPDTIPGIKKEMGDVLWYLSNLADDLGLKLSDIAIANLEKLQSRQARQALQGSGDDR